MSYPTPATDWQVRQRPLRLERRYDFADYAALRAFLDASAAEFESRGLYPDLSFGRSHAHLVLNAAGEAVSDPEWSLARALDGLVAEAIAAGDAS